MKIALLNYTDTGDGAARAAYRIHRALCRCGVTSTMMVNSAKSGDWTVQGPQGSWRKAFIKLREDFIRLVNRRIRTRQPILHSVSLSPSRWADHLKRSDADIIHLHWVNREMISVADIGRLRKPVVWTLHDMWAFCGAEHYTEEFRWQDGYTRDNRPHNESGFDINRWTWQRKQKHWRRPMHIVAPSRWLAACVRKCALMHGWPVTVVPNAIDTDVWQPVEKKLARQLLHLPTDVPLLLFGAIGGTRDFRKGFDLLKSALNQLRGHVQDLELIIFGQLAPKEPLDLGFPLHYTGHLHDDLTIRVLYSAADALLIPSRQDNLPNTGVEALACGTPVIAFDTCGLPDIVTHQENGFLAKPFEPDDLARGIQWVLADPERYARLCARARDAAVARFSYLVVAEQYLEVYEKILARG